MAARIPEHVEILRVPGTFTCSRLQGGGSTRMHLTLSDDVSRTLVVEARFDLETFARAITGQGELPVQLRIYTGAPWGMWSQHKGAPVLVPHDGGRREDSRDAWGEPIGAFREALLTACAAESQDGWIPNLRQAINPHCWLQWAEDGLGNRVKIHGNRTRTNPQIPGTFAQPRDREVWALVSFTRYVPRTSEEIAAHAAAAEAEEEDDRD